MQAKSEEITVFSLLKIMAIQETLQFMETNRSDGLKEQFPLCICTKQNQEDGLYEFDAWAMDMLKTKLLGKNEEVLVARKHMKDKTTAQITVPPSLYANQSDEVKIEQLNCNEEVKKVLHQHFRVVEKEEVLVSDSGIGEYKRREYPSKQMLVLCTWLVSGVLVFALLIALVLQFLVGNQTVKLLKWFFLVIAMIAVIIKRRMDEVRYI